MKKIMGVAAIVALLAVTGCSTEDKAPDAPTVEPAAASETPTPTPTEPEKSQRGNIVKGLGEGAGLTSDGEQVVTFAVNAISVDPGCTAEYAVPPENGHFIVLDVTLETFPELADSGFGDFFLSPSSMKMIAPNGTTSNVMLDSSAAWMCLSDAERLPSMFGPAEKAIGKVILDSDVSSGTLIISSYGQDAWEYSF